MLISIALAPRIPENIVVYRGVLNSFIRELKIDRKKDFWKRYKGFLSTSLISKFVLDEGYEAILRIYLPKGIRRLCYKNFWKTSRTRNAVSSKCFFKTFG